MSFNLGDVWFAEFPYEEDDNIISNRPVIILDEERLGVLSVKVTKHKPRNDDRYDIPLWDWEAAGLRMDSTARVSKVRLLPQDYFLFKLGSLTERDLSRVLDMYVKYISDNE